MALSPEKRMPCRTFAGAQTAQCGGAIQDPASVHTVMTPVEA
jgi:hypothetical protein